MEVSEEKIKALVRNILEDRARGTVGCSTEEQRMASSKWEKTLADASMKGQSAGASDISRTTGFGVFNSIDSAVKAAALAQREWVQLSLKKRYAIIELIRQACRGANTWMSEEAVSETGLGRSADKLKKNLLVIDKTPGIEILTPDVVTGDDGLTLTEWAPYGVIGSITPTTNPTETIINNGIGMIAAGNGVVFNPHPSAKKVSAKTVQLINRVIHQNGGPEHLIGVMKDPTIESARELMHHQGIRLLVVTGGPAVVKAAMDSGKKVIAAGPGNPPVVVDETADLVEAGRDIVLGASLDNNIVCIVEKEIIAVDAIADDLFKSMQAQGAYKLSKEQARRLEKVVVEDGHAAKKWVGKNAGKILAEIGVPADDNVRLLVCDVPFEHPFVQLELLMPVVPLVRAPNVHAAIDMAVKAEHGFGHTAVMHSKNIDHLHKMARVVNTSIFVKNAPSFAGLGLGGEGYTSFTIASPTGEGLTTARDFSRVRRCTLQGHFRIV